MTVDVLAQKSTLIKVRAEARVDGALCAEAVMMSFVFDRPRKEV